MALAETTRTVTPRRRPRTTKARGRVTEIQRSRMLAAALETVAELGYARMTVAEVIGRAKVSRKTFYDVFVDREDCFLQALLQAIDHVAQHVRAAYEAEASWRCGIRAALTELLCALDEDPVFARLCLVEALGAGPRVLARRAELLDELAAVIDRGRFVRSATREPPDVVAEGVVGAVFAVLHTRALETEQESFRDLVGPLMNIIVLPYLGARVASKEAARSVPPSRRNGGPPTRGAVRDPLAGLNMRLTYRTVRVLVVIGGRPGASNREIAQRSGIADQGQISKLLARLARLGLAQNTGDGQEKGGPNAWYLTPRGERVERATRPH